MPNDYDRRHYSVIGMGRPTVFSPGVVSKIEQAMLMGASEDAAARYAGISPNTLQNWLTWARTNRADAPISPDQLEDLARRIEMAKGGRQVRWLAQIEQAAQSGEWRAAAWKLERIHPEDFAKQTINYQQVQQMPPIDLPEPENLYIDALRYIVEGNVSAKTDDD